MIKKTLYLLFVIIFVPFVVSENDISDLDSEQMLLVHKTPTCGCCKMWMEHVEENGFTAYGQDHQNLMKIKEKYNIEPQYRSCHTKYIKQFLSEDHPEAIGLSVPGMPLGSPGMEVDDRFMPYDVLILFKDGTSKVYAEVRQ